MGDAARLIRTGWQRLVAAVLDCEKPVIAAVNATAAGGGMHLALACDLVLAAEEAQVHRGVRPAGDRPRRRRRLPAGPADRAPEGEGAVLLRRRRPGPRGRAHRAGQQGGAPGRADGRGGAPGRPAWPQAPTKAVGAAKYLTNRALDTDRATALWDEAVAQELVTGTEDFKEGLAAFAERRPPCFRGW